MILAYDCLKKKLPALNERRLTPKDFYTVARRRRCSVYELPLKMPGYYLTNGKDEYIFLDHRQRELAWLEIAFHEMIHLLLHIPCSFLERRHQIEARAFALIALIPQKEIPGLLREYNNLEEILQRIIYQRLQIFSYYNL